MPTPDPHVVKQWPFLDEYGHGPYRLVWTGVTYEIQRQYADTWEAPSSRRSSFRLLAELVESEGDTDA